MLTLNHNGAQYPIQNTEYYIRELASGLDEVIFEISIYDPIYAIMAEEDQIQDRKEQKYLVKQIDAGADMAKVVCQLDIDEWKASLSVGYDSGSKTCVQQITAVLPAGWTVNDLAHIADSRTLKGDYTPYDICVECTNVYGVYIRWNTNTKVCTIYPQAMSAPVGAFATRELNLKEINYKGKSNNLATRLYAYGKDGLSFADINNGKPYVDNTNYTNRVICAYWQDDRYTDKSSLLADAIDKLDKLSIPERSYDCSIVDLQATDPGRYNNLDFSLFKTATLIDDIKNTAVNYQVVERHIWPYHPNENAVIFDNSPQKITAEVIHIEDSIENPNSDFNQIQAQRIEGATNWLLSGDGYVVAVKGANGEWKELLFMDTDDILTAQNVLRINTNGIGFSTNGANGPYANAWTIDGNLVADFITTGTMLADRIRGGTLELGGYGNTSGILVVYSPTSLSSGSHTGTTIWQSVGYAQISKTGSFYVDINISDISDPDDYNAIYNVYHTSNGVDFDLVVSGPLVEGVNRLDCTFNIVNDNNNYYQISIQRDPGATATFDYNYLVNIPITTINKDGIDTNYIEARGGYIGNGAYGFEIQNTYIANQLTSVGDTSRDGAYYGINGMAVNAAGVHTHIMGSEIVTQGKFTIGTPAYLGIINGRFNNVNGMTIQTTPDSAQFALLHLNVNRWVPWTSASDRRLKENIENINNSFIRDFFDNIRPVRFNFKDDEAKTHEYGLIAQELEEVFKSIGEDNEDVVIELEGEEKYKAINYQKLVGFLLPAVKELYNEIDDLKRQIKELRENG